MNSLFLPRTHFLGVINSVGRTGNAMTPRPNVTEGQKYGQWLVIGSTSRDSKHPRRLCRCDCGTERWVLERSLLVGQSQDCGCKNGKGFQDLTGRRYYHWTVLDRRELGKNTKWFCRCDCGAERWVLKSSLNNGKSTSCGCEGHKRQSMAVARPDGGAAKNAAFLTYRYAARRRSLAFELSRDEFINLARQPCNYCGAAPSRVIPAKGQIAQPFTLNGIDRVDNRNGYVMGNCAPCCSDCNRAKAQMSADQFRSWIQRAYLHQVTRLPQKNTQRLAS